MEIIHPKPQKVTQDEFNKTPTLTQQELDEMHKLAADALGGCRRENCGVCGK
jgi:hypothetical protein